MSLFAKSIISEAEQQEAMKGTGAPRTRTVDLLTVVLNKIKFEPQVFAEVVKILESEPSLREQANELVHCYQGKRITCIGILMLNLSSTFLVHFHYLQVAWM